MNLQNFRSHPCPRQPCPDELNQFLPGHSAFRPPAHLSAPIKMASPCLTALRADLLLPRPSDRTCLVSWAWNVPNKGHRGSKDPRPPFAQWHHPEPCTPVGMPSYSPGCSGSFPSRSSLCRSKLLGDPCLVAPGDPRTSILMASLNPGRRQHSGCQRCVLRTAP